MQKSIKAKLIGTLLAVSILPFIIISAVLFLKTEQGFNSIVSRNQESAEKSITNQLNMISEELLALTESLADDPEILKALKDGNREKLAETVSPVYKRLEEEHKLDVFEFGGTDGKVFLRGHSPEKHGDDKSDKPAIQSALKGSSISGFEFGSSGLAVRAFVPLKFENEIIGTLQTGLDSQAIISISDSQEGLQLHFMNKEGEILLSSTQEDIGEKLTNQSILSKVLSGNKKTIVDSAASHTYIPLYDPTKSEVIGIYEIVQDVSAVTKIHQEIMVTVSIIGIIIIVIVMVIAILLSREFSNPIQQINAVMGEISKGNLMNAFSLKNRKDELGQLTSSVIETQENLKGMIGRIRELSDMVQDQSSLMKQSCEEISIGSNQVAATMQELSGGAESQAHSSADLAALMGDFSQKISFINGEGTAIFHAAGDTLELAKSGKELMDLSIGQMNSIHLTVDEAVQQMEGLDKKSNEINQLVRVIQEISEQTNLLALNAAIEAARAGEHGRGFAVVADEVRKLAEQVSHSIVDIKGIVEGIKNESSQVSKALKAGFSQVESGTEKINATGQTFTELTKEISMMMGKIGTMSQDLSSIVQENKKVEEHIEQIAAISEESAAGIEETSASAQQTSSSIETIANNADSLEGLSVELQKMVNRFQV